MHVEESIKIRYFVKGTLKFKKHLIICNNDQKISWQDKFFSSVILFVKKIDKQATQQTKG